MLCMSLYILIGKWFSETCYELCLYQIKTNLNYDVYKFCDVHSIFTITYMPFPGEILLKEAMSAGGPELDKFLFS